MTEDSKKTLGNVVQIDEKRFNDHLGELVRGTAEETLNGWLDAEADSLCGARRYEPGPDRTDYRDGSYDRNKSTIRTCVPSRSNLPSLRSTVLPVQLPTCWLSPVSRLKTLDLPTFGWPARASTIVAAERPGPRAWLAACRT